MSKKYIRHVRQFTPTFKKQVVDLIESGKINIASATREYVVARSVIYKWIYKYSTYNKKGHIMIIDENNRADQFNVLKERIAELERTVGHKQMQLDYYEKFVEIASAEVGFDLKKKFDARLSIGSSSTKERSAGQ